MANDYVLKVNQLSKSFGAVKALQEVSIAVRYGEVHGLAGENGSGKSTLIRSITGVQNFESGSIELNGTDYRELNPRQAMTEGVQVIYQDLSLFPNLSVAENIAFTWLVENGRRTVKPSDCVKTAQRGLDMLGYAIDLDEVVEHLPMAQRQIVAIARALVLDAKLIIMDEPTTALTRHEIDALIKIIHDLKKKGISSIFVSHKLDEVFSVADNITVLRDGLKVGDFKVGELDERKLSFYMTGREVSYQRYAGGKPGAEPAIEVSRLTREPHFRDISFKIGAGEVVGLTGPLGAGRTELALALFGLNPPETGEIKVAGKAVTITSPQRAIELGIGLLPEDRHEEGLFLNHPIGENLIAAVLHRLSRWGWIDEKKAGKAAGEWFDRLRVKAPSTSAVPATLSGGNQQRVVLGKWLATNPRLFILDSPTVGIDVGSKAEIHEIIAKLAQEGMAILMISDEISEVYHNCTRVLVMRDGDLVADEATESTDEKRLRALVEAEEMA